MPLEFRRKLDGTFREYWYGSFEVDGKRHCVNLNVRITGKPPASMSLKEEGDQAFERSRATALAKLNSLIEEARTKRGAVNLVEKLYEIKTGEQIKTIKLIHLPDEWSKIPRRRKLNEKYAYQSRVILAKFASFIQKQNSHAAEIAHVTRTAAQAFMDAEANRGMTAKTWNDTLKLLRATFKHLLPAGSINPFSNIPTRETETIFRVPFNPEELKAIVDAAQADDFIRPVLMTAICTAMRRGDCCLLKWKDVDLDRRFITVKTAKTGQTVSIPIFPMLYDELNRHSSSEASDRRSLSAGGYVFPEQAAMYRHNPDGITWRVRKVFAAAGFKDLKQGVGEQDNGETIRGEIHVERKEGGRRASIRDFHSFRVTWVTLALTAGVPMELVQKVTGHKTAEIVLKHYFQPGQEEFRHALQSAMPKLLTNGQKTPKEQMIRILDRTTLKTWQKDVKHLRKLIVAI